MNINVKLQCPSAADLLYDAANKILRYDGTKFNMSVKLKLVGSFAVRDSIRNKSCPEMKIISINSYCILNAANNTQNKIDTLLSRKSSESIQHCIAIIIKHWKSIAMQMCAILCLFHCFFSSSFYFILNANISWEWKRKQAMK